MIINSPKNKKMNLSEFELLVSYLLETYHLPKDYLVKKEKGFPLNNYSLSTPEELVEKYGTSSVNKTQMFTSS